MRIEKIYVDLDGVLSDFEGLISSHVGRPISEISKGYLWASINKYNNEVNPFFESLPLMKDAMELWNFVISNFKDVNILTATGNTPKDAAEQKRTWVIKHLSRYNRIITVTKSPDKANYASETSILIDDRDKSIDPWVEAGGIGILHTSAKETIEELKQYL